jgi:hypothetical protein
MILGAINRASGVTTTLDDLFRRAGVRHPDAPALVDPPNRQSFTDGAPRSLSYAQTDHAISAVAARLRSLGLPTDAIVAMHLPNTVDSIVAFLGILRAGMIAAPVPLLWRRRDMVDALGRIGAKAIVTCAHAGGLAHAEIAMHTAAALFPVRHICGFGRNLPDGIVSLEDVFAPGGGDLAGAPVRPDSAPAHVAAITFGVEARGIVPMARNHVELVSGGLAIMLEGGIAPDARLLSTIPVGSFAGLALTLMPWLLSGGTLHLHHGFEPLAFFAQRSATAFDAVVLPAAAVPAMVAAGLVGGDACTLVALWRAPEQMMAGKPYETIPAVVDVASFGEVGIVAARRKTNGPPLAIPHGVISVPRGAIGAMTVIETARSGPGTLLLRGPMVPATAFPLGAEALHLSPDRAGYFDTGYACRLDAPNQTIAVTVPPIDIVGIGGYRIRHPDPGLEKAAPGATVVALPHRALGQRLAGTAQDKKMVAAAREVQGANGLISGAFRQRGGPDAA